MAVNTAITEPLVFLDHIIASTNMVGGRAAGLQGGRCRHAGRCWSRLGQRIADPWAPGLKAPISSVAAPAVSLQAAVPTCACRAALPHAALRTGGRLRLPGGQPVRAQRVWGGCAGQRQRGAAARRPPGRLHPHQVRECVCRPRLAGSQGAQAWETTGAVATWRCSVPATVRWLTLPHIPCLQVKDAGHRAQPRRQADSQAEGLSRAGTHGRRREHLYLPIPTLEAYAGCSSRAGCQPTLFACQPDIPSFAHPVSRLFQPARPAACSM